MDLNVSNHKKNVFVARLIPVIRRHSQFRNDLHLEFASHLRSGRRTTRIQILEGSNMWYQSFLNLSDYNCILTDYHIVGHDGSKLCCGIHIMLMCVLFAPYVSCKFSLSHTNISVVGFSSIPSCLCLFLSPHNNAVFHGIPDKFL